MSELDSSRGESNQGIRAWAVLAVVIFHFFPSFLPLGYLGVDVFFVLSGFLITLIMERKSCLVSTYVDFFFKRFKRIFPLALLIALVNLLIISLHTDLKYAKTVARYAIYSLCFGTNFNAREAENYFEEIDQARDYFTHYWSLSVEIQFYTLAPFLLHILRPASSHPTLLLLYLSLAATCSFALSIYLPQHRAFSSTLCRLYQFLAGSMAFSLGEIFPSNANHNAIFTVKPNLAEVAAEIPLLPQNDTDEALLIVKQRSILLYAIPLVAIASGCIVSVIIGDVDSLLRLCVTVAAGYLLFLQPTCSLFCHQYLQMLGDASYALYLVHWPAVCLLKEWSIQDVCCLVAAVFACIIIAILVHFTYEKWYLTLSEYRTFALVGVLYVLCFSLVFYNTTRKPPLLQLGEFNPVESLLRWEPGRSTNFTSEQVQAMNTLMDDEAAVGFLFNNCTPRQEGEDRNTPHYCQFNFCNPGRDKDAVPTFNFCNFPHGHGNLSFLMIGNSYTFSTGKLVLKHFEEHYGSIAVRSIPLCEPLIETNHPKIHEAHKKFLDDVEREQPDVLFISTRYDHPEISIIGDVSSDPLYLYMLNKLRAYEKFVKIKVFILNSLPRLNVEGFMPEEIVADDEPMQKRTRELAKHCQKCVIYDIRGQHLNEKGEFMTHDPVSKLRYFDRSVHYTSVGVKLIEPVYAEMSREFDLLLTAKYPKNVFELQH